MADRLLTDLRRQLGADTKPITTRRLGELIGVPPATLRSVQAGRTKLSVQLQQRMRKRGVEWDQKSRKWIFSYNREVPLSPRLLEMFARLKAGSSLFQDLDCRALFLRIISLMQTVGEQSYASLLLDMHDALDRLTALYDIKVKEEKFADWSPRYSLVETDSGDQTLEKSYSWTKPPEPHRIFDLTDYQQYVRVPEQDEQATAIKPAAA